MDKAVNSDQASLTMDRTEVELMLSGIELSSVKRRKRYQPAPQTTSTPSAQ